MAFDPEEFEPRKKKPAPKDLSVMSVADLHDYIADMEAEIARARAAIEAKQAVRTGAEALFKK